MITIPMAEKISIIRLDDGRCMIKIPSSFKEMVVSLGVGHTMDIWAMNIVKINLRSPEKDLCMINKPILFEGEEDGND